MDLQLSQFENLKKALPSKKEEAWKYTSLTEFKDISWNFKTHDLVNLTHDQMQQLSQNLPSDFYNLVFINGIFNKTLSDDLTEQLEIKNIDDQDLIFDKNHVEKNLLNLTNACLKNKLQINIGDHEVFKKPLHIVYVHYAKAPQFTSEKINIHVGKRAEISLLVHVLSLDTETESAINLNLNLHVAEQALVKLIQIENENLKSFHFSQSVIKMESNSNFQGLTMALGGRLYRNYFHLEFCGHDAHAGVYGLNALSANQHADHYTYIQHSTGGNESRQLYKSLLAGASHSVFRGRVRIEKNAQKANSEQLNNNLLLTREAQADSIPQLEIYADDVKAGHGSTVGQLNKEEIFYFLSRGINQYQAVKMLSFGFARELIFQFENKTIQDWLLKKLHQKLDRMVENV